MYEAAVVILTRVVEVAQGKEGKKIWILQEYSAGLWIDSTMKTTNRAELIAFAKRIGP